MYQLYSLSRGLVRSVSHEKLNVKGSFGKIIWLENGIWKWDLKMGYWKWDFENLILKKKVQNSRVTLLIWLDGSPL